VRVFRSDYEHGSFSETRKVLRERYLRDDVGCGIEGCGICPSTTEETLPPSGDLQHKVFPKGHFILPDTNVFLAQMDLMESHLFTPPIILLQTVIEEVRHRSLPLYNRLKAVVKTEEKRVWIFYNEYRSLVGHGYTLVRTPYIADSPFFIFRETAIIRQDDESPNDRNDRGKLYPREYQCFSQMCAMGRNS
jgi:exosome complex exonuclease DIS3/RRP44